MGLVNLFFKLPDVPKDLPFLLVILLSVSLFVPSPIQQLFFLRRRQVHDPHSELVRNGERESGPESVTLSQNQTTSGYPPLLQLPAVLCDNLT